MQPRASFVVDSVSRGLPRFERPPVEEVSLAAHFKPLESLRTLHVGRLAAKWAADYPDVDEVPAMPPMPDDLGDGPPPPQGVQFEMLERAPFPRIWFLSEDKTLVRQVQRDRLVQNWRRVQPTDAYPHYAELLPLFKSAFEDLEHFAHSDLGADLVTTQCEISYTNPIRVDGPFTQIGNVGQLLAPWSGQFSDDYLPNPDHVSVSARFPITDKDGSFGGRLYVSAQPALHGPTGDELLLLQLAARGRPMGEGLDGILRFLDLGHEWIIHAFKSMTTPEMHHQWRMDA
jgi:uncharacterized protein (TIGR04255 family)